MKGIRLQWRVIGCARFLLFASLAAGQLTVSPSSVNFGNVQVGITSSQSTVVSNISPSKLQISQATVSGTGFSISGPNLPINLSPGQSVSFSVIFAPQSAVSSTGTVSLVSKNVGGGSGKKNGASSSTTMIVPVSGTGVSAGQLAPNPTSLSFGSVQTGTSKTVSEALSNTGSSSVAVSQATVTGAGFSISGLNLPFTLAPNQSYTFSATFAPTASGSASGSVSITSDASNPTLAISLSGSGTSSGQLAVSPTSLSFGTVTVGTSSSQSASLSASGSSVTISSASLSSSEFTVGGIAFPITLAAGQSIPFTVTFAPQATGITSATVAFASNASNSPTTESMAGTGGAPPQHSVALSWSDSSVVAGYNIYRGGTVGGPYTKINSALDATPTYTDTTVQAGQIYYYVTTAVDSTGIESGYSNEVQAVIPSP